MNGYRAIAGLGVLCALLVSAFAAQSASAVGTTAYTCTTGGAKDYASNDTHCKTNVGAGNGTLGHVAIANNTTTHVKTTNETTGGVRTPLILHAVINGVITELSSNNIESTEGAWMENKEEGGEMFAQGESKAIFKEVTVLKPANCKVSSAAGAGVVETNQLKSTTKGQGDNLQFTPAVGTIFAEFAIENNGGVCAAALNPVKLIGSVKCQPEGATKKFNSAIVTGEGTLRIGSAVGPKAGLNGSLTMKAAKTGEETKPIATTTS